jgi:chromosome segregation ATPase
VPKKQSEIVWKRFISACDYFFDRKEKEFKNQKSEQDENLAKKKALVEQIKSLDMNKDPEVVTAELKSLIAEWNQIGFVPFKEKDKLYKEYKNAIDEKFDKLNLDKNSRRMDVYKSNLQDIVSKGHQKLASERKRLVRQYEALTSEIATYENNIGFFSGSSKKAEGMIKDMEAKVSKLKKEREVVLEKIKMLEEAAES